MKRKPDPPRGYLYLKIFIAVVVALLVVVGVLRGISLFTSRGFVTPSYTTLYSNGEDHFLVSYHSPETYTIVEVVNPVNLSLEKGSRMQLSLALEVPIDAVVIDEELSGVNDVFSLSRAIEMILFPHNFTLRNINGLDALKYYWLRRGVASERHNTAEVDYASLEEEELMMLFRDEDIFNSAVSVEVMNGTEVGGLGGTFAEVLTHRGYNVIAITNTSESYKNSFVSFNRAEGSEAAGSLLRLMGGSWRDDVQLGQAADIVVVLGGNVAR